MNAPANNPSERPVVKIILSVVEGLLIAAICFGFGTFYLNLSKSTDIRWEYQPAECLNPPVCDLRKLSIAIYKLGGETTKDARLVFAVSDARYQVLGGSVQRSSLSIFNNIFRESKEPALGTRATLSAKDPELNEATTFDYTLNELEAGYRYDLTVILKSKTGIFSDYANFEVVNKSDQPVGREHLTKRNYVSLYFVEAFVLTIILVVALSIFLFGITWKGWKFFKPMGNLLRRKR
jgi:hypothetical protein